jgi:hypothetical protein
MAPAAPRGKGHARDGSGSAIKLELRPREQAGEGENSIALRKVQVRTANAPHPRPFPHKQRGGRENSIPLRQSAFASSYPTHSVVSVRVTSPPGFFAVFLGERPGERASVGRSSISFVEPEAGREGLRRTPARSPSPIPELHRWKLRPTFRGRGLSPLRTVLIGRRATCEARASTNRHPQGAAAVPINAECRCGSRSHIPEFSPRWPRC